MMAFCTKCGKQNPDTAKFCTGCGNTLKTSVIQSPSNTPVAEISYPLGVGSSSKKRVRWLLLGIIAILGLGAGAYFIFFKKKKELPVMMVLPESLKLRSSMSETGEDNVIRSAAYGTSVKIIDSTDGWYKVDLDGQKGYMHSRYLSTEKDFYETDAILRSAGSLDFSEAVKITESRFKKSLLRYFRNQHYIANIADEIKEKYFKDADSADKQVWGIKRGSARALTVIKGNFTFSSKKGIAVIIQNTTDPRKQKLLIFTYDDTENETGQYEFDEPELQSIWLGAESYTDFNGNHYKPGVDLIRCNSLIGGVENISFYIFRNGRMEKDYDYPFGD